MLQKECLACPGHKNCDYLARQTCQLCPFLLACPAEKLVQGFRVCDRTTEVEKNLVKTCLLEDKFTSVTCEDEAKQKFKCMRCGSFANCKRIYESEPIEAAKFDMFAEVKIETVAVMECAACSLRDKFPANDMKELMASGKDPVFLRTESGEAEAPT